MRLERLLVFAATLLAAALLLHSLPASAQGRATTDGFGTPDDTNILPFDINDSGQVTGLHQTGTRGSAIQRAFIYSGGSLQLLGTLDSTFPYSWGRGINNSGQVTGDSRSDFAAHAFVYSGGSMQDLGTLGGTESFGTAINNSGQVTGSSDLPGNTARRAFLHSGASMQDLGTLGGTTSQGEAINDSGQVTGSSELSGTSVRHAFLYSGASMQDLGTLGGTSSGGGGINASGQVTGSSGLSGDTATHAFLYSGGSMLDLGTLGGTSSSGAAINDSGQVTGASDLSGDLVQHAFLYSGGTMFDLNAVAPAGWTFNNALGINNKAQITGSGTHDGAEEAYLLTLHPDWQGGSGAWSDASHWNFAGFGAFGITPGDAHDVVINPAGSAAVLGSADATVKSLRIAGNAGEMVTLNLNGGSTAAIGGTRVEANAALAGSGLLAGELEVQAGGRVNVGAGEAMQLAGGAVTNHGTIRVLGTAANPASLEVAGAAANNAGAQIHLQSANVSFLGGLVNAGQINTTFGAATLIAGDIDNVSGGTIIVSNGAQATFFDDVVNNGELRISEGGAANFFGLVSGAGPLTGTGQSRFEGGYSPGMSPALVSVDHETTHTSSSPILMELGGTTPGSGHDKIIFNGAVTLEGGDLDVIWYLSWRGSQGDLYDLFDWNGGLSGSFGDVNLPTLDGGLLWNVANLYTTGEIGIAGPIPEPESYALLLAGLGLLGFAARRRKG
jgi:probable HAF family extracellular repeat protein